MLVGIGGLLLPIVLAAMARDRSLMSMIGGLKSDMQEQIKASTDPIHDRVSRVRDEYVRRDDLEGHLRRIDKSFDDVRADIRRGQEETNKRLEQIAQAIKSS